MKSDRRTFLKTSGLVGGAMLAAVGVEGRRAPVAAQSAGMTSAGLKEIPKGMTFCTLLAPQAMAWGSRPSMASSMSSRLRKCSNRTPQPPSLPSLTVRAT
jgi:hypothetical protein